MTLNRKNWFVLIAVLCGIWIVFVISSKREPHYQGEPISYWLEVKRHAYLVVYSHGKDEIPDEKLVEAAHKAIAEIGTNAIPYLLAELSYEEPRWKRLVPVFVLRRGWGQFDTAETDRHHYAGLSGFHDLGTNAASALPELANLLNNPKHADTAAAVIAFLPDSFPVLSNAVTNPNATVRLQALRSIKHFPDGGAVILHCLNDRDVATRRYAVSLMFNNEINANIAVSNLIVVLRDREPKVQVEAIQQLAKYRTRAIPALSALEQLLNSPNEMIRTNVQSAIVAIKGAHQF